MQASPLSPTSEPSFLKRKSIPAFILVLVAVVTVSGVFFYYYFQKSGQLPGGPTPLLYDPNGQVWYATGWDVTLHAGTTVQLDISMKSGVGPLSVTFYDLNGTHLYINEQISASKSWTLNIVTDGRHQLHLDNLDPNHQIVAVTVRIIPA